MTPSHEGTDIGITAVGRHRAIEAAVADVESPLIAMTDETAGMVGGGSNGSRHPHMLDVDDIPGLCFHHADESGRVDAACHAARHVQVAYGAAGHSAERSQTSDILVEGGGQRVAVAVEHASIFDMVAAEVADGEVGRHNGVHVIAMIGVGNLLAEAVPVGLRAQHVEALSTDADGLKGCPCLQGHHQPKRQHDHELL